MKNLLVFTFIAAVIVIIASGCTNKKDMSVNQVPLPPPPPPSVPTEMEKEPAIEKLTADESEKRMYPDEAQIYTVNIEKSNIEWRAKKVIGDSKHFGVIDIKEGEAALVDGVLSGGEVVIDMTTISNQDIESDTMRAKLEKHLKSEDFFAVEEFPTVRLSITEAFINDPENNANEHEITADLTIKSITESIKFPAKIEISENMFIAEADIEIDRTLWNVRYGSGKFFKGLGDSVIDDMIQFKISIVAETQ